MTQIKAALLAIRRGFGSAPASDSGGPQKSVFSLSLPGMPRRHRNNLKRNIRIPRLSPSFPERYPIEVARAGLPPAFRQKDGVEDLPEVVSLVLHFIRVLAISENPIGQPNRRGRTQRSFSKSVRESMDARRDPAASVMTIPDLRLLCRLPLSERQSALSRQLQFLNRPLPDLIRIR